MKLSHITYLFILLSVSSCKDKYSSTFNLEIRYMDVMGDEYAARGVKYYIKGDKIAMRFENMPDTDLQNVVMVMQKGDEVVYTIPASESSRKIAYRMNIVDIYPAKGIYTDEGEYIVESTDEKATVSGFSSRKIIAHGPMFTYTAWLTDEVPLEFTHIFNIANIPPATVNGEEYHTTNVAKIIEKGFPLWIIKEPVAGQEGGFEIRITNYQKTRLPDEFFDLSGYEIIDMTAQGKALPIAIK